MIRVVDWSKAIVAGASGALAMEVAAHALRLAGVPAVDMIAELGAVLGPRGDIGGLVGGVFAHAAVGIAWALFYAYFFWGALRWPPPLQGLTPHLQERLESSSRHWRVGPAAGTKKRARQNPLL